MISSSKKLQKVLFYLKCCVVITLDNYPEDLPWQQTLLVTSMIILSLHNQKYFLYKLYVPTHPKRQIVTKGEGGIYVQLRVIEGTTISPVDETWSF